VLILSRAAGDVLQVVVALTVLAATATLYWSPSLGTSRPHVGAALLAGLASGALRGATSMSGPPVVLYALSYYGDQVDRFRAKVLGTLLPSSLATIAGLVIAGLVDDEVLLACLAAVPTMVAGTLAGAWLRHRVSLAIFRPIVLSVLVGTSSVVLVTALAGCA
jgi:uncharacterized protein